MANTNRVAVDFNKRMADLFETQLSEVRWAGFDALWWMIGAHIELREGRRTLHPAVFDSLLRLFACHSQRTERYAEEIRRLEGELRKLGRR